MGLKWSEAQVKAQDRGQWGSSIAALSLPGWRGWVSEFSPLSVGSANESESLNQNPWPLITLFTTPEKVKTKIRYLNTLPHIWLSKLNKRVKFLVSSKKENWICMTLKPGVKKGVSLLIQYLGSLLQAVRSWGRRKQMWAGKKNSDGVSLISRPTPLSQRLDSGRLIFG